MTRASNLGLKQVHVVFMKYLKREHYDSVCADVHGCGVYVPHSIVHNAKCRGFLRTRKPANIWYNNIYFLISIVTIINRWMIMADDNMLSVNYNQRQSNTIKALRQS